MADVQQTKQKKPIQILRERVGGMSPQLKEYYKTFTKNRKALITALRENSATVPELAMKTGIPSETVMWHIIAMKKYGIIKDEGLEGDYYRYSLLEEE